MHNRVVIVTGASAGIGAALARELAGTCRLVLVARRRARLERLAAEVAEAGGQAIAAVEDLRDVDAPARIVAAAVDAFGGVDVLVNNAGLFTVKDSVAMTPADCDAMGELNLRAPVLLAGAAIDHLAANNGGWIVNVSSIAADASFPGCSFYAATKAGIEAWSRILREELRGHGVRVGVVVPGATDTEVWGEGKDADERARMCRAADVARAVRFMIEAPASASIDRIDVTPPAGPL